MRCILYCCLLGSCLLTTRCNTVPDTSIPYPAPLPDSVALPFLPGIVSRDSLDFNAAFSPDGKAFYFGRSFKGGWQILVTRYDGKQWTTPQVAPFSENNYHYTVPENLGPAVNSPAMEHDPCIAKDDHLLYFTSVERKDSHGSADIYYTRKDANQQWAPARNAGPRVNTDTYEYCSYLTPDGRYLFFSSNFDVKWIDTRYLPK